MARKEIIPTGKEVFFSKEEIIVSKTDLKGKIIYANTLFESTCGYTREELLNQPHNIIRHPDMPRCIFNFMWDVLQQQKEIFAYVINMCANGDHYWVLAHVIPTYDLMGNHVGYHSSRRCPHRENVTIMQSHYKELLAIEKSYQNPKEGMQAALDSFIASLEKQSVSYAEFIFSMRSAA
ncbi:putative sensor (PAS) domain for methyl-accepting chemotaxis sensory transducer [hydrothermal vent metagenome]|uniref:Putative sensor (PAS) domain for methyl-accepting chemotaxis sensory transducer n=1 Tax=hydrothermal vent metagenome TaxID=652676 RepID=A0A3B0RB73_9ZZZZ